MIKQLILITYCICCFYFANAQHKIIVGGGTALNSFKTTELNSFIHSFNAYFDAPNFVPFDEFNSKMQSISGKIGYRYFPYSGLTFGMHYAFGKGQNSNHSTLAVKSGYELLHKVKRNDFGFEVGRNQRFFNLSGLMGINSATHAIQIWKVYANGDKSMGYEDDLNGNYVVDAYNLDIGGSLGLKLWHFYVPIQVTYGLPFFTKGNVFVDHDTYRFRSNELPNNYGKWRQDYDKYDETNSIGNKDLVGLRVQVGLEFMIPLGK
jgi:hypothetical protein